MNRPEALDIEPLLPITQDPQHSYTLPSSMYTDAQVFEQEKQAIFYRHWHYVGHVSMVENAGDYVTAQIADESIFVIRGADGELRGFYNVCRHRAHQLVEGSGNKNNIVCPYHAWSYSHTGELQYARNSERVAGFDKSKFCLAAIRVEMLCGIIFVNLDAEAASLASQAADFEADVRAHVPDIDELRVTQGMSFGPAAINANWKVVVDNFVECYHCPNAHPAFAQLIEMPDYQLDTHGLWSKQTGPKVNPKNSAYEFPADAPVQQGLFWYLWPTTTLAILPGEQNLTVLSILPKGIDQTVFAGHRLGHGTGEVDPAWDYINEILGPEDTDLCESVQRGLKSRAYNQGKFIADAQRSGLGEHAVHHFHQLVLNALT